MLSEMLITVHMQFDGPPVGTLEPNSLLVADIADRDQHQIQRWDPIHEQLGVADHDKLIILTVIKCMLQGVGAVGALLTGKLNRRGTDRPIQQLLLEDPTNSGFIADMP